MKIKELPINLHPILGINIIYSGGGYFRLIPYYFIRKWSEKSSYVMTYFHPRDFDIHQPLISGLSSWRRFKSYYGLKKSFVKFGRWISDMQFVNIREANQIINWSKVKRIKLK